MRMDIPASGARSSAHDKNMFAERAQVGGRPPNARPEEESEEDTDSEL